MFGKYHCQQNMQFITWTLSARWVFWLLAIFLRKDKWKWTRKAPIISDDSWFPFFSFLTPQKFKVTKECQGQWCHQKSELLWPTNEFNWYLKFLKNAYVGYFKLPMPWTLLRVPQVFIFSKTPKLVYSNKIGLSRIRDWLKRFQKSNCKFLFLTGKKLK